MDTVNKSETLPIRDSSDLIAIRQRVRAWAVDLKLSLVDQTKIVTAASELARNTLQHGGGGKAEISEASDGHRRGIRLTFSDQGPGIQDLKLAMSDGYSSKHGLGLGLSGSKRLMNEFTIETEPGKGTVVTVVRWK